MLILVAFGFIAVWTVAGLANRRQDTFFSPLTVLGFAVFFYGLTIPLELYFREKSTFGFMQATLSPQSGLQIAVLATAGFACSAACYTLVASTGRSASQVRSSLPPRAGRTPILVFVTGTIVALVVLYPGNLVAAQDYATNVSQTASSTTYSLLVKCSYIGYGLFIFLRGVDPTAGRRLTVLLSLPLMAWGLVSNDKDPILIALLAVGGSVVARSERAKGLGAFLFGVVVSLAGAVVGAVTFSVLRAGADLEQVTPYIDRYGLFLGVDPLGPTFATIRALEGDQGSLEGRSILAGFLQWVPSIIYPDKMEDLAASFARDNYPFWRPGTGFGYSPVAEGLVNFGPLGVLLVFGLMGLIFGAVRNLCLRPTSDPGSQAIRLALFHVFVAYTAFIAMRGTFAGLITTLVVFGSIAAAMLTVRRAALVVVRSLEDARPALVRARPSRDVASARGSRTQHPAREDAHLAVVQPKPDSPTCSDLHETPR